MIGLGDIAEKAYLPVLSATPGLDLLLCTRDRGVLERLGDSHRVAERFTSVEQVIDAEAEAAFVHAATGAHVEIVETLLRAGVHVYVDKPIADNLAEAEKLVRLAGKLRRSLMVGFNRRYAPGYVALRDLPRDLIIMQKNRARYPDDPRRAVFEDFIHVVDTLLFLAPGDISDLRIDVRVREGLLEHVVLHLSGQVSGSGEGTGLVGRVSRHVPPASGQEERSVEFTALGIMGRTGGASEETCEIIGGGHTRRVVNLADVIDYSGGETVTRRGDWIPVARQRGIEQLCHEFLASVREGRLISAEDALPTHAICEQIVTAATH
ncbi:Gfo/Idh/MocA family oxidoreductase [Sphaerisporangium flaviroseum]